MSLVSRRHFQRILASLVVFVVTFAVIPAPPADAFVQYSSWKCAPAGCKYAQARIKYDRAIKKLHVAYWRGGTASQSCDPDNDVIKWRLTEIDAVNGMSWDYGPTSYKYNCNVYSTTYGVGVYRYWSGGLDMRFEFFHDVACSGCDFPSVMWHYA